jgi:hypothetical protein
MAKSSQMMRELARMGAAARVTQLRAELAQLERSFPGVTGTSSRRGRPAAASAAADAAAPAKRKRRKMSAAARKKISDAQKRRWAKQKAKSTS